jgi:hypothetical protein
LYKRAHTHREEDFETEDQSIDGGEDDAEGDDGDEEEEDEEDDGGWEEDIEMEETELDADNNADAAKGKGKAKDNKKSAAQEAAEKKGGMAGIIASIGVAATDVIASQIVGQVFGDIPLGDLMSGGGGGGGDIDLGGLDTAGDMVNDDIAGIAEDGVDEVKDGKDDLKGGPQLSQAESASDDSIYDADGRKRFSAGAAGAGAAGAILMGGVGAGAMLLHGKRKVSEDNLAIPEGNEEKDESDSDGFDSVNSNEDYDEFDDEENTKKEDDDDDDGKKKKKKRFGFGALKDIAAATVTGAKETIASTFLGDDFAEMLVERMEESDESDSDEDDDDGKKKKGKGKKNNNDDNDDDSESGDEFEDEIEKPKSKKRGLFRRGKK